MATETRRWMDGFGQDFDIFKPVEDLSVADRQMVAMARALSQDCRVLILDEPTASMTPRESSRLLEILGDLRADGVTILFISHRLQEVLSLSDSITVLRDGRHVLTCPAGDIDEPALIRAMVGRDVPVRVRKKPDTDPDSPTGTTGISAGQKPPPLLEVNALTLSGSFEDISLSVHAGEIVGLAGLVGSGRSEVARAVFGIDGYQSGSVRIEGELLPGRRVRESIRSGLGMVPEDRQHEGLILALSIHRNLVLTAAEFHRAVSIVDSGWESGVVTDAIRDLQIKASDPSAPVETLSGGNQQKVVLGRWMAMNPKILILDEPTRGVDVGAKAQVHELIRRMAGRGMGILVISSDLSEILALADRTIVMREGRISGSLTRDQSSEESIMQLAFSAQAMEDRL
jgi:rhamnose transport system ATP-binding protein